MAALTFPGARLQTPSHFPEQGLQTGLTLPQQCVNALGPQLCLAPLFCPDVYTPHKQVHTTTPDRGMGQRHDTKISLDNDQDAAAAAQLVQLIHTSSNK